MPRDTAAMTARAISRFGDRHPPNFAGRDAIDAGAQALRAPIRDASAVRASRRHRASERNRRAESGTEALTSRYAGVVVGAHRLDAELEEVFTGLAHRWISLARR